MLILDCYIKYFSFTKEKAIEIYKTLDIDKKYKMMPDYYEHYNIEESAQEFLIKYNNLMSAQRRKTMSDMKKYLGVKMIEAEPQTKWNDKIRDNHPIGYEEGYKVVYKDGYVSWSPKDVFEESYRQIDGMTFGLAIEALKKGLRVARKGWNGKNQYIELAANVSYVSPKNDVVNVNHEQIGNKAIAFVGTSGVQLGWLASQADMLSEDWQVIEND